MPASDFYPVPGSAIVTILVGHLGKPRCGGPEQSDVLALLAIGA